MEELGGEVGKHGVHAGVGLLEMVVGFTNVFGALCLRSFGSGVWTLWLVGFWIVACLLCCLMIYAEELESLLRFMQLYSAPTATARSACAEESCAPRARNDSKQNTRVCFFRPRCLSHGSSPRLRPHRTISESLTTPKTWPCLASGPHDRPNATVCSSYLHPAALGCTIPTR